MTNSNKPALRPWSRPLSAKESLASGQPEALAAAFSGAPGFFWLDSADVRLRGANAKGRWSYLGARPAFTWTVRGDQATREDGSGARITETIRPFKLMAREFAAHAALRPDNYAGPAFAGGWIALLGYDLGRDVERLPVHAQNDLPFPELRLAFHEWVLAYDHAEGCWWFASLKPGTGADADALLRAHAVKRTSQPSPPIKVRTSPLAPALHCNFTREDYEAAVRRALEYIAAGDIYQLNLSQRFESAWSGSGLSLYQALCAVSPAPFGACLNVGPGLHVASISPELFLQVRDRNVVTRPIKGTRPRGATPEEDQRLAADLEASLKERAELTMIVDLERNDLGKVCDYGSVRVVSPGELEAHPTVFHRVATVTGRLHERRSVAELLRATFPGGSVTGAPKKRALELIEELEPARRGPYCGALGWIGADGNLELNLAIRTALFDVAQGKAWYQAGGGIVADSDPAREYDETLAKARAFFTTLGAEPL